MPSFLRFLLPFNLGFRLIWSVCSTPSPRFKLDANAVDPYYEAEIEAMRHKESTTMYVDFSHVMRFNDVLQKAISEEYLR